MPLNRRLPRTYQTASVAIAIDPAGIFPSLDEQKFESASAPDMIDLFVGSSNFSEAQLFVDSLYSDGSPVGVTGSIFAAAIALSGVDEETRAAYSYRFHLGEPVVYQLVVNAETDDSFFGGSLGISVLDDNVNHVFGSDGSSTQRGSIEPGYYNLLIDAEAYSPYVDIGTGTPTPPEYLFARADFTLLFTTIPEPANATLAGSLAVLLICRRYRRFRQ